MKWKKLFKCIWTKRAASWTSAQCHPKDQNRIIFKVWRPWCSRKDKRVLTSPQRLKTMRSRLRSGLSSQMPFIIALLMIGGRGCLSPIFTQPMRFTRSMLSAITALPARASRGGDSQIRKRSKVSIILSKTISILRALLRWAKMRLALEMTEL